MRVLLQRVTSAEVTVDGLSVGRIGPGLCLLVGVSRTDGPAEVRKLAAKVWQLRVFPDVAGTMTGSMSSSLADRAAAGQPAEALVVSQFTLYGDTSRGRRPSWSAAAPPETAAPLVEAFASELAVAGATVATGRFGADMQVALVNDGPVTLLLEAEAPDASLQPVSRTT